MMEPPHVTPKQAKWFEKVREGLEQDTGKTLNEWISIAKTCPETTHKKRLKWFKDEHALGINRASTIIGAAFETGLGWDNPEGLLNALWKTQQGRAVYDAVEIYTKSLSHDTIVGPRKTFSGFSRKYQFAALRPYRGEVRLGLAVDPVVHDLQPTQPNEGWSDRLKSAVTLATASDVNTNVKLLIRKAWQTS